MLDRRGMLAATGALMIARPSLAAGSALAFDVSRRGSSIGRHRLEFLRDGDAMTVRVAIDLAVKLGPIPLYRYTHRNEERWQGNRLAAFSSTTDDNGTRHRVEARLEGDEIVAVAEAGRWAYPAGSFATTYWHRSFLERPRWINSQTGEPADCTVTAAGREPLETAGGSVDTDRFKVVGPLTLDLWYEGEFWAGMMFPGPDGADIRYVRDEARGLEAASLS